jgi:hypothetical protein
MFLVIDKIIVLEMIHISYLRNQWDKSNITGLECEDL